MKKNILGSLLLSTIVYGCGTKDSSSNGGGPAKPAPTTPEETPPGVVSDEAGFFVKLVGDTSKIFSIHKGISTFDSTCKAALGEQVNCFVEGEEQSFAYHKISLHYNIPKTMCDYVMVTPFYFVNRQTTRMDTDLVTYTDKNGRLGIESGTPDGTITDAESDIGCYTKENKPICCVGKYNWINHVWQKGDTKTPPIPDGYDLSGPPAPSPMEVHYDSCLGGPATLTQPKTYWGLPVSTYEWVSGTGVSKVYEISESQKSVYESHGISWNVNFSKSADHLNTTNTSGFPYATQYDVDASPSGKTLIGEPYYRIGCYDTAWETKAEILIQLRDWNTKAAYEARATAPDNYHEEGMESTPFGVKPINDNWNWKDIESPLAPSTTPVSRIPNFDILPK